MAENAPCALPAQRADAAAPKRKADTVQHSRTAATGLDQLRAAADASPARGKLDALQRRADASPRVQVLQGVFHPVRTTEKTRLRRKDAWQGKVGRSIPEDTEIVADKASSVTVPIGKNQNVSMTRAVDVKGKGWDAATHDGVLTYIRTSKLGADRSYGTSKDTRPLAPGSDMSPNLRWTPEAGEYVEIEPSRSNAGALLVYRGGRLMRLTGGKTYVEPDAFELQQINPQHLKAHLFNEVEAILLGAASGTSFGPQLAQPSNIDTLAFRPGGSQALRWEAYIHMNEQERQNWRQWMPGVMDRIKEGAVSVVQSLEHWRDYLYLRNADKVTITDIEFTGSDLHEHGLGVLFVDFAKPSGVGPAPYTDKSSFRALVKPEDKRLERAIFGDHRKSLANKVNKMAGLSGRRAINTFNMVTSRKYGSLIELVKADQFKSGNPASNRAMREAMVFAFITGLSDLHYENLIWDDQGLPWFIDADNALNQGRLTFNLSNDARGQSGFKKVNEKKTMKILDKIENDGNFDSKLLTALKQTAPSSVEPVLKAVKRAFTRKSGRAVPVSTTTWGQQMRMMYIGLPEGSPSDTRQKTRWATADVMSQTVPVKSGSNPGLVGETGIARSGRMYDQANEKMLIKSDLDRGQIPFYRYEFDTGHVWHKSAVIWHGQPLDEALEILFNKFPGQR